MLACGCLYPFPPDLAPENGAPELKDWGPRPNADGEVEVVTFPQTFHVTVLDPELDDVEFDWSLSRDGPLIGLDDEGRGEGDSEISRLTLDPAQWNLDTQVLRCTYWDVAGNGAPQEVTWRLSEPAPEGT